MKKNILLVLLILLGINPTFCMKRKRPFNDDSGEERRRRKVENYSDDPGYQLLKELLGASDSEKKKIFTCPVCDREYRVDQYVAFVGHVQKNHRDFKREDDPEEYKGYPSCDLCLSQNIKF